MTTCKECGQELPNPDIVHCGFCGRVIHLKKDKNHYLEPGFNDHRYKCEQCYYHPGHQYK